MSLIAVIIIIIIIVVFWVGHLVRTNEKDTARYSSEY